MIEPQQVFLPLDACPSFEPAWQEHRHEHGDDLLYVALDAFPDHLLHLQQTDQTRHGAAVAHAIERLHLEGMHYVREAATIGLLEGIQNVWPNNGVNPEVSAWLRPESAKWWQSLNTF